jgi:hypothetical protein
MFVSYITCMSNFVTFKVQVLFYFDRSKLIKFNWEPPAMPASTARHDHVAALMHVARQKEDSSAHRASVAGLPCRYMWRGKVGLASHVGRRGQTGWICK